MAGLVAVRDALANQGQTEAATLAGQLHLSAALVSALLEQLVQLGLAQRVEPNNACGDCRSCPAAAGCATTRYAWRSPRSNGLIASV